MELAKLGWRDEPVPTDLRGNVATFANKKVDVAFRFGVDQAEKLRACDDSNHNRVNLHCTVWTPIKLPTWVHVSKICLNIRTSGKKWAFYKAGREAAYKQLPIAPSQRRLAAVALRNHETSDRVDFPPKALLLGSAEAVLRYSCFSRLLSVLFNLLVGIPLVGYFDDFGALIPLDLSKEAIDTFVEFCTTIGVHLGTKKAEVGWRITFLGLRGDFPRPPYKMAILIRLHPLKAKTCTSTMDRIITSGSISRKELESVIGRLSFAQTSVFGRICRSTLAPLYTKLHMETYFAALTLKEATPLRWWALALAHVKPGRDTPKPPTTERIVYADSAGKSKIISEVCHKPETFASRARLDSVRSFKTGTNGEQPSGKLVTYKALRCWPSSPFYSGRLTSSAIRRLPSTSTTTMPLAH